MSEEQQQNDQDLAQQVYEPPEEFAKNANIQDPEIWDKAAEGRGARVPACFWL